MGLYTPRSLWDPGSPRGAIHSVEGVSAKKCEKLIRAVDLFQYHQAVLDNLHAGSCQCVWVRGAKRSTDLCVSWLCWPPWMPPWKNLPGFECEGTTITDFTNIHESRIFKISQIFIQISDLMTVWGNVGLIYWFQGNILWRIYETSAFQRAVFAGAESPLLTHADETPCHFPEAGLKICLKANIQISLMQPGSGWWMCLNGRDTRVFLLHRGCHMCESSLMLPGMTAEEPS